MRQHTLTRTRSYYARGNCCSVCVWVCERVAKITLTTFLSVAWGSGEWQSMGG